MQCGKGTMQNARTSMDCKLYYVKSVRAYNELEGDSIVKSDKIVQGTGSYRNRFYYRSLYR